jgi:hypothetical protein
MSFSAIEITRTRLDAFEGESLKRFESSTDLSLSETDAEMAEEAVREVKIDLSDLASKLVYNGTYADYDELLDEMANADNDEMISRLMHIKFLELFFADNSMSEDDKAYQKSVFYEGKYVKEVKKVSNTLLAQVTPSRMPNRPKFTR